MKKFILALVTALILPWFGVMADDEVVTLTFHKKNNGGSDNRDHAPLNLPINVYYDDARCLITIDAPSDLDADLCLYDSNGAVVYFSPSLPTEVDTSSLSTGTYVIVISFDSWSAIGLIYI